MKYFLVFAIFGAFIAIICAGSLNPGDEQNIVFPPWNRVRRSRCDFYGCQRYCYDSGHGTGPKGGGVCVNNNCDCNEVPKDDSEITN